MMIDELATFLAPRLSAATTVDDVAALMSPLASDSTWAYLGGSGARQQFFRFADDGRAVFQFSGDDLLTAYAVYRTDDVWPADESRSVMPVTGVALIVV
jgi:hypothetical protein